jgi:proline iminopeptidase
VSCRTLEDYSTTDEVHVLKNKRRTMTTSETDMATVKMKYVSEPASNKSNKRTLYPPIEPYHSGLLDVGDGHQISFDVSGNPDGIPAVFLHGGPGGGVSPRDRQFFDPAKYRIVIFDQRGCGKSVPNAADDLERSLVGNTTWKLVDDIDKLRRHLKIEKWGVVLGGSWGTVLALAYAQTYPHDLYALVLRGVFLFTPNEIDYLFCDGGTYGQHPEAWEMYCQYIKDTSTDWDREKTNLLGTYWNRLVSSDDVAAREAAASAFVGYELSISKTFVDRSVIEQYLSTPSILIPFAVMEVHYMLNNGYLKRGQLLEDVHKLTNLKVAICHGRADYVCQPQAAWRLYQALKHAGCQHVDLEFVAGAGHSDSEPGLVDAMVRATDKFAAQLNSNDPLLKILSHNKTI